MKNRFIIVIILLIVAFVASFVPQYIKVNRLENELSAVRQESDPARNYAIWPGSLSFSHHCGQLGGLPLLNYRSVASMPVRVEMTWRPQ